MVSDTEKAKQEDKTLFVDFVTSCLLVACGFLPSVS